MRREAIKSRVYEKNKELGSISKSKGTSNSNISDVREFS
jgi:hypothetical protein